MVRTRYGSLGAALALLPAHVMGRNNMAQTPPMGWMSWEIFRCTVKDCEREPDMCINEKLYQQQTDALAAGGYTAAGYSGIHIDDCWMNKHPARDENQELIANTTRFPNGMKALGDYMHPKGATFGLYTAESPTTCGGYPASAHYEDIDAKTFAKWGVDYLKVDGCGSVSYYEEGYHAMGAALEASGRNIEYSCSWPAYIGSNETTKPFGTYIMDGCNEWRNWDDIQCNWGSLSGIIDHWGDYGSALAPFAGPGHWHDMDMLLIGGGCIKEEEEQTQMAIWSISASPLIMGNDLRNVSSASRAVLLNEDAIAVSQDPLGQMGIRHSSCNSSSPTQLWSRMLHDGSVAVGLYNKAAFTPGPPVPGCPTWTTVQRGYYEACGGAAGDIGSFSNKTVAQAQAECCANPLCAGMNFKPAPGSSSVGSGFFKGNANCGITKNPNYTGYTKPGAIPHGSTDITLRFADLDLAGDVAVYDIWAQKTVGTFSGSYTAKGVPLHGTAFLRLTAAPAAASPSAG